MTTKTVMLSKVWLEIHWPDGRTEEFKLSAETLRIGRHTSGNDITAPEGFRSISRKHCEIRKENDQYLLYDLETPNGVILNGTRIMQPQVLQDQDTFTIGVDDQMVLFIFNAPFQGLFKETFATPALDTSGRFTDDPPGKQPHLHLQWPNGKNVYLALFKERTLLGRDPQAECPFPEALRYVSARHAEIRKTETGFTIRDLKSTNGTLLNGRWMPPDQALPLHHGDMLRIGDPEVGSSIGIRLVDPTVSETQLDGYTNQPEGMTQLIPEIRVNIGRIKDNHIVLDSPTISRLHAYVTHEADAYWLTDNKSLNGTLLNGQPVSKARLSAGDIIQIGSFLLTFDGETISRYDPQGMRVDVADLSFTLRKRKETVRILEDINMTILPREFVAIVGGSGAGKTTLINALIGSNPGDGKVLLNGNDFYEDIEHYRDQIGYVPQADILHTSLTVEQALSYTSLLRMPRDTNPEERERRIASVLETVNMNTERIRKTRISQLSGGERKRVSIAAELLADPKLLYLDEPTSGLDPGLEKKMMFTLRTMADQGRTVVLITHATANIIQVDHVAFLSQGKLIYFGPPREALEFFGVEEFADIYERIANRGAEWKQTYEEGNPEIHQRYVLERVKSQGIKTGALVKKAATGLSLLWNQGMVLIRRAFKIQTSDWITLALMTILYPFTATLQLLIASPDIMTGDLGILADPVAAARTLIESYIPLLDTRVFVFVTALEAVLIGMYVPSNELILERSVYLRERMVNLKILPYLFSKIVIFAVFALIQCSLYLAVLSIGVDLPADGLYLPGPLEMFITVFLTMLASVAIGLFVSSLAKSPDMGMYVLVMLLFFQFFFAGIIFDLRDKPTENLSYLTNTRWAMTALGVTVDMEKIASSTILCSNMPDFANPQSGATSIVCVHNPESVSELQLSYKDEDLVKSWAVLIGMGLLFYVLTAFSIKRLDKT